VLGPVLARYPLEQSQGAALSADGAHLAIGRDGFIEVIDLATQTSTRLAESPGTSYFSLAYDAEGGIAVFALDAGDTNCRALRLTAGRQETLFQSADCSVALFNPRIAPDGRGIVWHRQAKSSTLYRVAR